MRTDEVRLPGEGVQEVERIITRMILMQSIMQRLKSRANTNDRDPEELLVMEEVIRYVWCTAFIGDPRRKMK